MAAKKQGGSPNRGEGVPFNETVNLSRYQGNSSYVGIGQPQCLNCNFMPGGFAGGYPLSPFTLNAGVSMRGVQPDYETPLVHKWNFVVQRELPGNMALEIGYEGNHGTPVDSLELRPVPEPGYIHTYTPRPRSWPTCALRAAGVPRRAGWASRRHAGWA